jgi:putative colanic acid polymerase
VIFIGLTILSGLQYFLGDYFPTLNRPFGSFTNYYALLNSTYGEHFRSTAFFNEPSYNALVASSFIPFVCYRFTGTKRSLYFTVGLSYVFFTHSLSGILLYGVLTALNFFSKSSSRKILVFVLPTFVFLLSSFISERSSSINVSGSSSNFRLVAPLEAAKTVVPENPFGIVLGSLERHMHALGFLNGTSIGTSLDNGIFLIIVYFGIVGFLGVLILFIVISIKMNEQIKMRNKDWYLLLIPILMLLFTGGIFTPEFVFILVFAIYFIRIGMETNLNVNSEVRKGINR